MKIGILTYHRARNYGAFLQAYGLCRRLNEEPDIDAEIIDFHMHKEINFYSHKPDKKLAWLRQLKWRLKNFNIFLYEKKMQKAFDASYARMPLSSEYKCSDSIEDFQEFVKDKYDIIIAGSDEIWKTDAYRGFPSPYWLPGDLGCIKMSYAASCRSDLSKSNEQEICEINRLLNDFSCISVRDEMTRNHFNKYLSLKTTVVKSSDPSIIYDYKPDAARGREILKKKAGIDKDKKISVTMLGRKNEEVAECIKRELSDQYEMVAVFEWHKGFINIPDLTPFEWVDVIACADLVCASFFHAICFSVICHVPFLAFNIDNKGSKLKDVLEDSGNMDRLIEEDQLSESGFLRKKASEYSYPCSSDEYVAESRLKFEEYLSALRRLV